MGLDVYMAAYKNHARTAKREVEREKAAEAAWQKVTKGRDYKTLTEAEKNEARAASAEAEEKFIPVEGEVESFEMASKQFPEHMFKIGYFRSSYNDGGINRVLRNAGVGTLYDIFAVHDGDGYHIKPNWTAAKKRVKEVIAGFEAFIAASDGCSVTSVSTIGLFGDESTKVQSETDALAAYVRVKNEPKTPGFDSFSNKDGYFFLGEPMKVKAAIPGTAYGLPGKNPRLTVYLVHDSDDRLKWYVEALKIVEETIDFVLEAKKKGDKRTYVLHWSS